MRRSILTMHRRILADRVRQVKRYLAGRYVWDRSVLREIEAAVERLRRDAF